MIHYLIMIDNLIDPDTMIAKLKAEGRKNKDIAKVVYPDLPIQSAVVKVSRHLKNNQISQYIEQTKTLALKKHGVEWDYIIGKLKDKAEATKSDFHTGALIDDNSTQMAAIKQLVSLMDGKPDSDPSAAPTSIIPSDWTEIQIAKAWKNPPQQN